MKFMNNSNYKNYQFSTYFTISNRNMKLVDLQFYYNRSCGLMDKALHFECGDCRFESCHDRNFCPFNQLFNIELVSKELNHFEVIADLFRQIGGHSTRFVLFGSF